MLFWLALVSAGAAAGAHESQIFTPIDASRGWQEVSTQIRNAIVRGDLRPGDRLAPQRELAGQFGVSRALINEALRVLEHSGLIYTRPGAHGGSFVRAPAAEELVRHLNVFIRLGGATMETLTDFRLLLEGENAAWAAKRATTTEVQRLRGIVAEVSDLESRDIGPAALDDLDAAFHLQVAEMARNGLTLAAVQGILPALRQLVGLLPAHAHRDAGRQLTSIADAIAAHRRRAASDSMRAHIRHWADILILPSSDESDPGGTS